MYVVKGGGLMWARVLPELISVCKAEFVHVLFRECDAGYCRF